MGFLGGWCRRTMVRKAITGRPKNLGKSLACSLFLSCLCKKPKRSCKQRRWRG